MNLYDLERKEESCKCSVICSENNIRIENDVLGVYGRPIYATLISFKLDHVLKLIKETLEDFVKCNLATSGI